MAAHYYDPVRKCIATPLDYAVGPSNGHRAVAITDALRELDESIRSQLKEDIDRVSALTELRTSLLEAAAVSALKHRDAIVNIRAHFDEVITALRRREEAMLREVSTSETRYASHLAAHRTSIEQQLAQLTADTNVLQNHLADPNGAHSSPETAGRDVVEAWLRCDSSLDASSRFVIEDDFVFDLSFREDLASMVDAFAVMRKKSHGHSFRPMQFVSRGVDDDVKQHQPDASAPLVSLREAAHEPSAQVGAAAAATLDSAAASDITASVPKRLLGMPRHVDAHAVARGIMFALGTLHLAASGQHHHRPRSSSTVSAASGGSTTAHDDALLRYHNPLQHGAAVAMPRDAPIVDVVSSVPLVHGSLTVLSQQALYGPRSTALNLEHVRTVSNIRGCVIWWDFGHDHVATIEGYALVHGGSHLDAAMRSWTVTGTNSEPPYFTAAECRDRAAVEARLHDFTQQHCHTIDGRAKETALALRPMATVYCNVDNGTASGAEHRYRFVGLRCDEATSGAKDRCHIHLAGVEWYGRLHRK